MGRKPDSLATLRRKFEEQKPLMEAQKIMSDEVFVFCDDKESFHGRCYAPAHPVSNYGRVWTLNRKRIYNESGTNRNDSQYKVKLSEPEMRYNRGYNKETGKLEVKKTVYVSWLVANYFCDKSQVELLKELCKELGYEEKDISVHHKRKIALNKNDFYINYYKNVQFIDPVSHELISNIQNGSYSTIEDIEPDPKYQVRLNAIASEANRYDSIGIVYERNDDGKVVAKLHTTNYIPGNLVDENGNTRRPKELPPEN